MNKHTHTFKFTFMFTYDVWMYHAPTYFFFHNCTSDRERMLWRMGLPPIHHNERRYGRTWGFQSKGSSTEIHQVMSELSLVPDRCDPWGCVWSEPCSASTFHATLQFIDAKLERSKSPVVVRRKIHRPRCGPLCFCMYMLYMWHTVVATNLCKRANILNERLCLDVPGQDETTTILHVDLLCCICSPTHEIVHRPSQVLWKNSDAQGFFEIPHKAKVQRATDHRKLT